MRILLFLLPALLSTQLFAQPASRLSPHLAKIDALFSEQFEKAQYPGLVYGIVADGQLVHVKSFGVQNQTTQAPVTPRTVFRIASMTKSFTALAILKLRDQGKLSLEDPIVKFIPQAKTLRGPTSDSPALTVRHLLTHNAGFPEDNPWGDRQLAISEDELDRWLAKGLPFSTAPGTAYEYSNYGFALLGRIVARASGISYAEYLHREILQPLGLRSSYLEAKDVPASLQAFGYGRRQGENFHIPSLSHGAFGAMGGLHTSAEDLARYVAFHLSAFPARNDADPGPVRRSSVREMQQLQRFNSIRDSSASGYGYGLNISQDCNFAHIVGHGGGLPGFGSYMMWLPDFGIGIFAMANQTYASTAPTIRAALTFLLKEKAIAPRALPVSPTLEITRRNLISFWENASASSLDRLAADNLYSDLPRELRVRDLEALQQKYKGCQAGPLLPENLLRGVFRLVCQSSAEGAIDVEFTLAPTTPPGIQYLRFREVKQTDPLGPAPRCKP